MDRKARITEAFIKAVISENSRGEIEPGVVIEVDDNLEIHTWCRGADGVWREPSSISGKRTEDEMVALVPDLTPPA